MNYKSMGQLYNPHNDSTVEGGKCFLDSSTA